MTRYTILSITYTLTKTTLYKISDFQISQFICLLKNTLAYMKLIYPNFMSFDKTLGSPRAVIDNKAMIK